MIQRVTVYKEQFVYSAQFTVWLLTNAMEHYIDLLVRAFDIRPVDFSAMWFSAFHAFGFSETLANAQI